MHLCTKMCQRVKLKLLQEIRPQTILRDVEFNILAYKTPNLRTKKVEFHSQSISVICVFFQKTKISGDTYLTLKMFDSPVVAMSLLPQLGSRRRRRKKLNQEMCGSVWPLKPLACCSPNPEGSKPLD